MLINAERQPADQDAGDLCDPTQYAPRDRRPYWNEDIASFSAAVWLPTGTTAHNAAINRAHGWASKTAAHSWFSTNRLTAPNPDLPNLYSPAAVQDTATRATAGATKQQTRRIQVYPDRTQKLDYRHLDDRQPLDLQPHRRDPAVRHSSSMETHRQHGNAGSQSATSRMGFGSLPGEAHRSQVTPAAP